MTDHLQPLALARSAQLMATLSELNKELLTRLAQRAWHEDVDWLCTLMRENAAARLALSLSLICFALGLLLRVWRLTCKILE